MGSILGLAAAVLVMITSIGRVLYQVHTAPTDVRTRILEALVPRCCRKTSRKTSQKPEVVFHVHVHRSERRARPRSRKTRGQPSSYNILDGADGREEYIRRDGFPRFLELPLEIREKIYDFAMDDRPTRYHVQDYKRISPLTVSPATLPYLCYASKQLHKEVLVTWIRRTRFIIGESERGHIHPLTEFLSQVDGFRDVRMLSYRDLTTYVPKYTLRVQGTTHENLAAKCTGLRGLILGLDSCCIVKHYSTTKWGLKGKEEMAHHLRLGSLYELDSLRKLKIEVVVADYFAQSSEVTRLGGLKDLKEMVTEGFEAAGKGMVVKVESEILGRMY